MALNYLLDPMFQIENSAGKPATDGWLEVYIHGTRNKYYCASNFDGTLHPFKIKLDSLGSNIVLADDEQSYDVYAYNRFGSLLMSRYNVTPGKGGGSGGGGTIGNLQHWLGMYGPTYTHFPGDEAGHTLGLPRQSVDYEGDFIDHIETAPYPDGDVPAYIYLKPGLYLVECVIRYQQDSEDVKNTLDEVLIYTGHGNANEDVAYQLDASGPDTNGNRHCLKQSFIRKVTENDGSLLYFAPGTPTDWTDAYIQTLSIVKLDSVAHDIGLQEVYHDDSMTGKGTPDEPLSVQDALDGKQDTLTAGEGIILDSDGNISVDKDVIQEKLTAGDNITIDSDGVISTEGRKYTEGWGIDVDNVNNTISADPDEVQRKLTAGVGINLDSDGNISGNYRGGYNIEVTGNTINKLGHKLIATNNVSYTYCKVFDFTWQYVYGRGQTVFSATHYGGNFVTFSVTLIRAVGTSYTVAWPYVVSASPSMTKPNAFIEKLEIRESGNRIIGYLKLRNFSQNQFWLDWEGHSEAGYVTFTPQLTNEPEGDIAWTCEVSKYNVPYYQDDIDSNFQQKLTAGDNITIDSDGVISAAGGESNVFIADVGTTPYDDVKAAVDAGKVVIARLNRIQMGIVSDWTDMWGDPAYLFGVMNDQYQGGFPRRLLYRCRKLSNNTTEWVKTQDGELALQSNVNSALNAKQDKLTAGDNITIDSNGVISAAGGEQVQSDWDEADDTEPSYIRNKPDLSLYQKELTAGEGINLDSDGNISVDTDVIQEKLTPGEGIDIDENGVISNTFEQVQSDWAQEDSGEPDYIKNKPDMDDYQKALTAGDGIILDSDGNISVDKETIQEKLTPGDGINIDNDGVITADPQVQSDWEEDDVDSPAYIQNKPDLSEYQKELTAGEGITIVNNIISVDSDSVQEKLTPGEGINIDSNGVITAEGKRYTEGWGIYIDDEHDVISVDPDIIQQKLTPGEGIEIDSDGNISLDLPPIKQLVAGENITIVDSDNSVVISAADSTEYTAGFGIEIDGEGSISVDTSTVQEKLTAGEGVNIDSDGVITAEGRQYTEGWGIDIDENNVISVDQSIVQEKLTEGDGIDIDSDGVISVDTESLPVVPLVAGNNITIEESNGSVVISAEDATVDQTYDPTSANAQSGTAVAEAVATKEDEFDAGDGLEFITDSDGNRVLQVEGPVDVVAGPGIVIDNPDGNTLRISQQYPTDETVLYSGTDTIANNLEILLSENYTNFERIRIYGENWENWMPELWAEIMTDSRGGTKQVSISPTYLGANGAAIRIAQMMLTFTSTKITVTNTNLFSLQGTAVSTSSLVSTVIRKVVGVHRIANN